MGILNAPETFQKLMNLVFSDFIKVSMVVYMDYILISNKIRDENLVHIETVLKRIEKNKVSRKMYYFMDPENIFIGLLVDQKGFVLKLPKRMKTWPKL